MGERLTDAEIEALIAENTRLRAALAQSDQPCAYCSLPADEWAKCANGFPGCARGDDAMGCPHLGASLESEQLRADLAEAHAAIRFAAHACDNTDEWKALHAAAIERAQEIQ